MRSSILGDGEGDGDGDGGGDGDGDRNLDLSLSIKRPIVGWSSAACWDACSPGDCSGWGLEPDCPPTGPKGGSWVTFGGVEPEALDRYLGLFDLFEAPM